MVPLSQSRALALDHTGLEIDQADLHLQQPHGPGNDQGLGRRPSLPGRAASIERIGRSARAEHHVEGDEERERVGAAVGCDIAVVERQHAQVEQNAHQPGPPAQREADGGGGGHGEDDMGDRRIVDVLERREPERARRLPGFRPLEQAGARVPVIEFHGHQRQVTQEDQSENDPERPQRPRRDRSEQESIPRLEWVHGRTSFSEANSNRSSI